MAERFFSFDERDGRLIVDGGRRYYVFRASSGRRAIVPDACPHRGGPLHMGRWDPEGDCLACPWHRRSLKQRPLLAKSLPAIASGSRWTVALPGEGTLTVRLIRREVADARGGGL